MDLLVEQGLYSSVLSVLRQELDTLLRVLHIASVDPAEGERLAEGLLNGDGWRKVTGGRITDREMVESAQLKFGWTGLIYRYGCAGIHLSEIHGYREEDPFVSQAIIDAISNWWGESWTKKEPSEIEFRDVVRYLLRSAAKWPT